MPKSSNSIKVITSNSDQTPNQTLTGIQRLKEFIFILVLLAAVLVTMTLLTFNPSDPSWSQTAWDHKVQNLGGQSGASLASSLFFIFGRLAYLLPLLLVGLTWVLIQRNRQAQPLDLVTWGARLLGFMMIIISSCGLVGLSFDDLWYFSSGGVIGEIVGSAFISVLGGMGAIIALLLLWCAGFTLLTGLSWAKIIENFGRWSLSFFQKLTNSTRHDSQQVLNANTYQQDIDIPVKDQDLAFSPNQTFSAPPQSYASPLADTSNSSFMNAQKETQNFAPKVQTPQAQSEVDLSAQTKQTTTKAKPFKLSFSAKNKQEGEVNEVSSTGTVATKNNTDAQLQTIDEDAQYDPLFSTLPKSPSFDESPSSNVLPEHEPNSLDSEENLNFEQTLAVKESVTAENNLTTEETFDSQTLEQQAKRTTSRPLSFGAKATPIAADSQSLAQQNSPVQDLTHMDATPNHNELDTQDVDAPSFDEPIEIHERLDNVSMADKIVENNPAMQSFIQAQMNQELTDNQVNLESVDTSQMSTQSAENLTNPAFESIESAESVAQEDDAIDKEEDKVIEKPALTMAEKIMLIEARKKQLAQEQEQEQEQEQIHHVETKTNINEPVLEEVQAEDEPQGKAVHTSASVTGYPQYLSHLTPANEVEFEQDEPINIEETSPAMVPAKEVVPDAQKNAQQAPQPQVENSTLTQEDPDLAALSQMISKAKSRERASQNPFLIQQDNHLPKPTSPMPTLDLLQPAKPRLHPIDPDELERQARLVEAKLADFKIEAQVVDIFPGPVITRFELDLAPGMKVSRITGLSMDLARSLSAPAVRVVEVIPGKPYIGLELPNLRRETVYLSEVLGSKTFQESKSPTSVVLGQDIAGEPVIADISKMPHVLVAGTTGSGKSVGVNVMILSILYKATPEDVRFIMIDPKMLELSIYEGIPHLLSEVVTDMKDASNALRWCVGEMERRYQLMSKVGVRNLAGYNDLIKRATQAGHPIEDPLWKPGDSMDEQAPYLEKLPSIVVVVDEFADLMMVVGKKVEELIARLAQKARAAGIHLILATQRPSVDVITGLIKANIPTRVAFTVSTKTDSRTILDQGGAETLLGMGDMLYLPPGSNHPIRVHGAFASDDDVHAVASDWKARGRPQYIDEIIHGEPTAESLLPGEQLNTGNEMDELYDQVVEFVTETRRGSISLIQRKFSVGYNRAAKIVEQLEENGVVSGPANNGAREVLAPPPVKD